MITLYQLFSLEFLIQKYRRILLKRKGIQFEGFSFIDSNVGIDLSSPFFKGEKGKCTLGHAIKLSKGTQIDCYGGQVKVGENTFLGPYTVIYGHGNVTIGSNNLIAMGCKIIAMNHSVPSKYKPINEEPDIKLPITIGNDVWLGADVKILAGVSIGDGCIVGAGSVVTKSIPPFSYAVGVPAKIIKERI